MSLQTLTRRSNHANRPPQSKRSTVQWFDNSATCVSKNIGSNLTFTGTQAVQAKSGCSCGGGCLTCASSKTEMLEREADAVADQVMRKATPSPLTEADEEPMRKEESHSETMPKPLRPALSGGDELPPGLSNFFSTAFGHDFSNVKIHRDINAQRSAKTMGARAYTYGSHIAFNAGEYSPTSFAGRHLIAHELAHVVQQGAATPKRKNSTQLTPTAQQVQLQRQCGPSDIHDISGCTELGGDIFGTPYLFEINCDSFKPGQEKQLKADAKSMLLGTVASVNVHGFASEDGDAIFNQDLSCLRAAKVASILRDIGINVTELYAHGSTPGEPIPRRSVVLDPRESMPSPELTPEPTPKPNSETKSVSCGSLESWIRLALNTDENLLADLATCSCEIVKLLDVAESLFRLGGSPRLTEKTSNRIEKVDCLCNLWDWLQLIYKSGSDEGCWAYENISLSDHKKIHLFLILGLIDCFSDNTGKGFVKAINTAIIAASTSSGGTAGSTAGPAGTGVGALFTSAISYMLAEITEAFAVEIADFGIDLVIYMGQNSIKDGTTFPLSSCKSCARIPTYLGGSDRLSWCDN